MKYDEYAFAQKIIAASFFEWLQNKDVFNLQNIDILELGCGSGFLSQIICNNLILNNNYKFLNSKLELVDISQNMLSMCENKLSNLCAKYAKNNNEISIKYTLANAEYLNSNSSLNNKIILSNMCMQWFDDIDSYIKNNIHRSKFIAFTLPTANSFKNWQDIHKKLKIKCALHQLVELAQIKKYPYIYKIKIINVPMHFSSIKNFMQHFKFIGAYNKNSDKNINYSVSDLRKLFNYQDGEFNTSYEIAMVLCKYNL
jgi:ubiquinone/menaquinone biosynthesis C-methylase UbiE